MQNVKTFNRERHGENQYQQKENVKAALIQPMTFQSLD